VEAPLIRGHKIILDSDLAVLYGVSVGRLNEAVKRNRDRFPTDFMFQLTRAEFSFLRSQIATSNLKSQIAISSFDWGGRRVIRVCACQRVCGKIVIVTSGGTAMNSVEDLDVFKLAHQLALKTYSATKTFPKEETYSLSDQTRRAAA
jgi:ORF6N domain/23S rRNA-intervening sequence protein